MSYILNIGMDNLPKESGNTEQKKIEFILDVLKQQGISPDNYQVLQSNTEPTLVLTTGLSYSYVPMSVRISVAAKMLNQGCIAVVSPYGEGYLLGPNADKWGKFNPQFFLYP